MPLNSDCTTSRHSHFPPDSAHPTTQQQVGSVRVGMKLGGDPARTANVNLPQGYSILYHGMLSNKIWGRGRYSLVFGFQDGFSETSWAVCSSLPVGGAERFHLLHLFFFSSPIKLPLSQPMGFLTFALPMLSPVMLGWAVLVLGCWPGSTHHNLQKYNAGIHLLLASNAFKVTTNSMLTAESQF